MAYRRLSPNLMVEDVNRTVEFYRDVLGFDLAMTEPKEGRLDWAMLRSGQVTVMFQRRASLTREFPAFADLPVGGSFTLYIDVDDVRGLYERVRERAAILSDLKRAFYGAQEFTVRDPNGYVLTFAEGNE